MKLWSKLLFLPLFMILLTGKLHTAPLTNEEILQRLKIISITPLWEREGEIIRLLHDIGFVRPDSWWYASATRPRDDSRNSNGIVVTVKFSVSPRFGFSITTGEPFSWLSLTPMEFLFDRDAVSFRLIWKLDQNPFPTENIRMVFGTLNEAGRLVRNLEFDENVEWITKHGFGDFATVQYGDRPTELGPQHYTEIRNPSSEFWNLMLTHDVLALEFYDPDDPEVLIHDIEFDIRGLDLVIDSIDDLLEWSPRRRGSTRIPASND